MENKYYTPDLEEYHVDFEFEYLDEDDNTWNKTTINNQSQLCNWTGFEIQKRVAYLSQSDIESFGFECTGVHVDELEFEVDEETFLTLEPDGYVRIADYGEGDVTRFSGVIKNKSELNKLLKQLNIIE